MERHAKAPSSDSSTRRGGAARAKLLALLGACLLCALVLLVASAGASKGVLTYFGSSGEGDGQFGSGSTNPMSVAVNRTGNGAGADQGDVYAVDNANHRVLQFEEDGAFVRAFGWGVDDGSDAFQVCTSGCQAAATPSVEGVAGALPNPQSVAIDQATGNVYVLDRNDQRIDVYGSDGSFQAAFGYGVDTGAAAVELCTAASTCQQGTAGAAAGQMGAAPIALAIDPTDGGVYVADRSNKRIDHYDVTTTAGVVTAAAFSDAFGWDVDTGGLSGAFETCTTACRAGQGTANGIGQFNSNQPVDVAVDSTGAVFAVESVAASTNKRRLQKFAPGAGTYTASEFAPAVLSATANSEAPTNVAIGAADHVFVVKQTPAGATPACPDGSASKAERRVLELSSDGSSLFDTHMSCAGINSANSLAANPTSGRLYLASSTGENRVYVLDTVAPPVATVDPVTDATATTATFKGHVNPGGVSTSYRFEYSSDGGASWTKTVSPNIDLGSGSSTIDVESARVGLQPHTAYQVRLVAEHPFNAGAATTAPVSFNTAAVPPVISISPSVASAGSADLHALVNPRNSAVENCLFEWGPTTAYGHFALCQPGPGAGGSPKLVSAHISGLSEGTTYHYRLIAVNAAGTTEGEDLPLTTPGAGQGCANEASRAELHATFLPDCRSYEMVSPPDKNGGEVLIDTKRTRAAQQLSPGEPMAFQFSSLVSFANPQGTGISSDYLSVRGATGWRTHGITPLQDSAVLATGSQSKDPIYENELSADLSKGVVRVNPSESPLTPDSGPVQKVQNLYLRTDLRDPGPGTYQLLSSCPLCLEPGGAPFATDDGYKPFYAAASHDFSHVFFESRKNLLAGTTGTLDKAYEWHQGSLSLIGRVPASGDRCDDQGAPVCIPAPSSTVKRGFNTIQADAVSADGSRVLFDSPAAADGNTQIYMRIGARATVHLNASERTVPAAPQVARIDTATPDGRYVFFTTAEPLLDSDTNACRDLYRYDLEPLAPDGLPDPAVHHLTLVSVDQEPADHCTAVEGIAGGVSGDGQTAYFLGNGQLVAGAPLSPSNAALFVFAWREGALRYIGWLSDKGIAAENLSVKTSAGSIPNSRVTLDGSGLLFSSYSGAGLTGYDHGSCANSSTVCRELYLYDAEADGGQGRLSCVSCRPDGLPAATDAAVGSRVSTGAANFTIHVNHPFSADGRYVFFDTGEALVGRDTNGARDVYAYDSQTGQLGLISSGTDPDPSYFLDASADGTNVFFATREQLSGWDVDGSYDVYDARIAGGLPEPPAAAAACAGESCRPSATAPPAAASAASAALRGAGNAKPNHCPKGRRAVARKGKIRCVKRKHRQRHHRSNKRTNRDRRASR